MSDKILNQLVDFGLEIDSVITNGEIHRVKHKGDKGNKKNGWYLVFETQTKNGAYFSGCYGWWKEGTTHKLTTNTEGLTSKELAEIRATQKKAKEHAEKARVKQQNEVALKAKKIFGGLPTQGHSKYLEAKQVANFGCRFGRDGILAVPVQNNGKLYGLQWIYAEGRKIFNSGMRKKGCYHLIGNNSPIVAIAEGYATAASVHMATGWQVAVAFDAGNLAEVAKEMRKMHPQAQIIIAGDDDRFTDGNPGRTKAENAAYTSNGVAIFPRFKNSKEGVDWNDLHVAESLDVVKAQLTSQVKEVRRTKHELVFDVETLVNNFSVVHGNGMVWDGITSRLMKLEHLKISATPALVSAWMSHPLRRIVDQDDIVFNPYYKGDDKINLFTGFDIAPAKGECNLLLELLLHLCGGDEELKMWLLNWVAFPLQNPGAKMKTAVVMHGAEGTGKNLFWEAVAEIYSKYSVIISQAEIESDFNGWSSGKLFVIADEVISRAEMRHMKGRLKGMVTGDKIMINEKGLPQRQEGNHMNMVFLSNEDQPLALDDGDRRYTVVRCDKVNEADFYARVGAERRSGGVEALYHFLLGLNLGGFNEHTKPFDNQHRKELISLSKPSPERFYKEWYAGDLPVSFGLCTAEDLYGAYKAWCRLRGERVPFTQNRFGRMLKPFMNKARANYTLESSKPRKYQIYYPLNESLEDGQMRAISFREELEEWISSIRNRGLL